MNATNTAFKEKFAEPFFGEGLPSTSAILLQARIKDLKLHLSGTQLERCIQQLYAEMEAKGLKMRPECYLSDQWGCPSDVPVIGIPFYLADPAVGLIEEHVSGAVESEQEIMMYLRHEAGHAFNYAYRVWETDEWRRLFGDYSKPYNELYKPKPFSRNYVVHITGWYAQKHPDEDFAETFAVWLTPDSNWQERYKSWGAIKKLQYMDDISKTFGTREPIVTLSDHDLDVDDMEETVLDHYRQRLIDQKIDLSIGEQLDQDLVHLFEAPADGASRADTLVRAERHTLTAAVTQYSGLQDAVVSSVLDHLIARLSALELSVHLDNVREYVTRLTALVTALAMNYVYTDRFFEVD